MSQRPNSNLDDEIDLRQYIMVLRQKWWLILAVIVVVSAVVWFTSPPTSKPLFETRTRLLLVESVSESITSRGSGTNGVVSINSMSSETLLSLATASDLLQVVIDQLDLRDEISGEAWAVERLDKAITAAVDSNGADGGPPLITVVVRAETPALSKNISDQWKEAFVNQNSLLFASEVARSYDFVLAQYRETEGLILQMEEERRQNLAEHLLPVLKDELVLKQNGLKNNLNSLLDASLQLSIKNRQREGVMARLNELSVDGNWIGLQNNGESGVFSPGASEEHLAALQARDGLFRVQERLQQFYVDSGLTPMKETLELKKVSLGESLLQLQEANSELSVQSATAEALETELQDIPEFLLTVKAINDQALWQQLGIEPTADDWERVRELGIRTEEVNPVFTALSIQSAEARASIESQKNLINSLASRVEEMQTEIAVLDADVYEFEEVQLARLLDELELAQRSYDRERISYAQLRDTASGLRDEVNALQLMEKEFEDQAGSKRTDVENLSKRVLEAELDIEEFNRRMLAVEGTYNNLARIFQDSQLASADQAGTFLVVESPVEPSLPVPETNSRRVRILIGVVLGLVLGVVTALMFDFVQRFSKPGNESNLS